MPLAFTAVGGIKTQTIVCFHGGLSFVEFHSTPRKKLSFLTSHHYEGEMLKCVTLYKNPISLIAIVGEAMVKKVGLFAGLTGCLAKEDINIFGISAGQNSITAFVDKSDSNKAYHLLHQFVIENDVLSSLSLGRDTAMITFVSPDIIDTPGIISRITEPLRKHEINILEIISSQTAIVLFVDWKDGEKARDLVNEVLE